MKASNKETIATYLLGNPHLLALSIIIILVGGFSALQSMPRLEDPIITNRNALIITLLPGASAGRVEAQITEKIEDALKEIPEIKEVDSTSRANISLVSVGLADDVTRKTNREIFSRIRDKLDDAAQLFPPDALEPVFDDKRGASAFSLLYGLSWQGQGPPPLGLLKRQAENLADILRNVPGTNIVRIYGEPEEQILVEVDPQKMSEKGLTIKSLSNALRAADVKIPSGELNGSVRDLLVEVEGELDSVERISRVPILSNESGDIVRLEDIAAISLNIAEPPREISRSGQKRTILVGAKVLENRRVDLYSQFAEQRVEEFSKTLGEGTNLKTIFIQNEYTSDRLSELAGNLFLGGVVIFLVIFFFMGWRASWIVGSALPLTAALTLFIVAMTGGKLHQMSIFGMIIALGLLIDNAIVVTEEIRKHMRKGNTGKEAVAKALQHLFIPLLSSTMTTIFAFAPILLLPGNAGDFVGSIGGSVIIALSSSFLVAMTIIATLTGKFGGSSRFENRLPKWMQNGIQSKKLSTFFHSFFKKAFSRPLLTIVLAAIIPFVGFKAASTLGVQFFPRTDRNMFELQVWLPTSTNIYHTHEITEKIEESLRNRPEIINVHWLHGSSFPAVYYNLIENKDGSSHYAQAIIEAVDFKAVKRLIPEIQKESDSVFPEAQIVVTQFAQGPPNEADVELRITGPNIRTLQNIGEEVRLKLAEHPDILHTQVTMPRGEPKVIFTADEQEAKLAGLQLADLAGQLQANLQGVTGGTVIEDIEEFDVLLRLSDSKREDFDDLRNTRFINNSSSDSWIPISALGDLEIKAASGGITRRNGERVNIIRGYTRNAALPIEVTQSVLNELKEDNFHLPTGYHLQIGGDQENQSEAVGNLLLYLPVLMLLTVSILILSFRSVMLAAILGVVAFLSIGFGLLATWFAGLPLSFNTILGSLGLVGLAFNSSIVVLASIRSRNEANAGDPQALAEQVIGSARHLISTTLTTIGSFMPLLIFIGGDFWPPLAVVLAGGVGGSTFLAMFFTPSAFRLITILQNFSFMPKLNELTR